MIRFLEEWVRTLAVGAVFCAVVLLLISEGSEKRAVKLICAVMLTLLLVRPLQSLDADTLTEALGRYKLQMRTLAEDTEDLSQELYRSIILRETEEYIWDAARKLEIPRLGIRLRLKESGETVYPWSVDLTGRYTEEQRDKMSLLLEGELGIPLERQTWSMDDAD